MKTGLFLAALVQLTVAQPHQNRHAHLHEKRDVVVVTQVQTVTATAHNAVVYVNQQGQVMSTSYCTEEGPQPTPVVRTSVVPAVPAETTPAAAPAPHAHAHGHKHHHHHEEHSSNSGGSGSSSVSNGPAGLSDLNNNIGIVYSPYNSDSSCKTEDQVSSDFQKINGYSIVRLYGTDCNQVATVAPVAKSKNMRLFLGVYDLTDVTGDLNTMHSGLNGDWSNVDTVNIGNELVNSGINTPEEVVSAISQARGTLEGLGYHGPVVTVDTFNAMIANPSICDASDYAAANAHAFFDPDCTAPNAGSWAKGTAQQVAQACNGKDVVITESGWPHRGIPNGAAVPGWSEQSQAISSLKSSFASGGIILYTSFDDLWKEVSASTFDAEPYWGFLHGQ